MQVGNRWTELSRFLIQSTKVLGRISVIAPKNIQNKGAKSETVYAPTCVSCLCKDEVGSKSFLTHFFCPLLPTTKSDKFGAKGTSVVVSQTKLRNKRR